MDALHEVKASDYSRWDGPLSHPFYSKVVKRTLDLLLAVLLSWVSLSVPAEAMSNVYGRNCRSLNGFRRDSVDCLYLGCGKTSGHNMWCKFPLTTPGEGSIVAVRSAEIRSTREHPATRSDAPPQHQREGTPQDGSRLPHRFSSCARHACPAWSPRWWVCACRTAVRSLRRFREA